MNREDNNLRALYVASQKDVHAPSDLMARTLELVNDDDAVSAMADAPSNAPAARKLRFSILSRKPLCAAAACLALAAMGFGAMQAMQHSNDDSTSSAIVAPANLDFAIKAYAAGTQTPLAAGDNGMIVFGHESDLTRYSPGWDDNGTYTGCLFKVEAEGVKTVQAHISKGMLYRYDTQNATLASDPGLLQEALTWKPLKRGLGEQLGGYDEVSVGIAQDGLDKDDPSKTYQVQTSKRLGQTAQLDYDGDDANAYFGLWTDEVDENYNTGNPELDQFGSIANTFEGAQLTVTVTFEDGHTSTQVIELHAGNFLAQWSDSEDEGGMATLGIDPTLLGESPQTPDSGLVIRTVYGEVSSSSNETFPYADQAINEYANVVDPPMTLRNADGQDFLTEGTSVQIAQNDETFMTLASAATTEDHTEEKLDSKTEESPTLKVSDFTASIEESLPADATLEKTEIARLGSLEYWNRIASQRCGFTLDEAWRPSEGACILHARYTVQNTSNQTKYFRAPYMQTLGKLEDGSTFCEADMCAAPLMFNVAKPDGESCGWYDNDMVTLQPGETAIVDAYWEVSVSVVGSEDLAIGFGANGQPNVAATVQPS